MITRYVFKFYRETDGTADYNAEFVDSIVGTDEQAQKHCDWLNSTNEKGHIYFIRKDIYDYV